MLTRMQRVSPEGAQILVIDSCGERASIALFDGAHLRAEYVLVERTASTDLLPAIRNMLDEQGMKVKDLEGFGVVSGPGSFTGVRVGLAMAKGLCEATGKPVAAVSRLAVLAQAAGLISGFALLSAGRNEVYLRELDGDGGVRESMVASVGLERILAGATVAVPTSELGMLAEASAAEVRLVELSARHAIASVQERFATGGDDLGALDANYVRNEEGIYRRSGEAMRGVLA